jgi:hypothetical protein
VKIIPKTRKSSGTKLKRAESLTDARGKFALRVPAVPAAWSVRVEHNRYQTQTRILPAGGEQRYDLAFLPDPVPGDVKGDTR